MNSFCSFDGTRINFHDDGSSGRVVMLLHGYGLDALGNYGDFERSRGAIERNLAMFKEKFGVAPPMPAPPAEGRAGLMAELVEAGARVVAPDLRGFGASGGGVFGLCNGGEILPGAVGRVRGFDWVCDF